MNAAQLNSECLRLQKIMADKGYLKPNVCLYVNWIGCDQIASKISYRTSEFSNEISAFPTVDVKDGWDALIRATEAEIAKIPSVVETKHNEFINAVGKLIDQGRDIGIDVDFLNPLTEMMKKLSSNVITNQTIR